MSHELLGVEIVVPTYCPDAYAIENIARMGRMAPTVVVDDGSPPGGSAYLSEIAALPGVHLLSLPINSGIAAALNLGVVDCIRRGAEFVMTFDQDSSPSDKYVVEIMRALRRTNLNNLGCIGPGVVSGRKVRGIFLGSDLVTTTQIIQSGMVIPKSTVQRIGLFDEDLFIDAVDTDYCLRMRRAGLQVLADPELSLEHRLGAGDGSRQIRIGPFRPTATFHSAARRYYINRNLVHTLRRYGLREPRWAALIVRRVMIRNLLACLLEDHRRGKVRAAGLGLWDGFRGESGKCRHIF
ncbi:glycosyltransferase [Nocardioides panaciterrulae]|uniref:Rhamnosyltransferase n=1 Tax=Nocardioides panaciterrulae TaxID=661492 RepID=A0A7Y9E3X9_9ACTN|nr:glycosyltransferase [Nocardioides panaciterrulae]NYD40505.1 rhamnosyltransferase [Nocardioides panaciterrulae]